MRAIPNNLRFAQEDSPLVCRQGVPPEVGRELQDNLLLSEETTVDRFIARFGDRIIGVLSGFDRLVFRGTLRQIAFATGMMGFLWKRRILLKDFGSFAEAMTEQLKQASLQEARRLHRPIEYLQSGGTNKEAIALEIAERDHVRQGLIGVLTAVEPCLTYEIYRNRDLKKLQLVPRTRKCLFLYHYFVDPVFGFMNARIQTWFPFSIQICLNGREWLSRQMDRAGLHYRRRSNCFPWIEDVPAAQTLMDEQLQTAWPQALNRIARQLNPDHSRMFKQTPLSYYWSAYQSEWATDLLFQNSAAVAEIYPWLVHHGITTFSSPDVMRFLGQRPHWNFQGEVVSSFKDRTEGVRLKHWVGKNSVKLYDKEGSLLRVETTIHDRRGFKVFRPAEGDPDGPKTWRHLRAGIADLHRRAEVSHAANDRYLDALSSVTTSQPLGELIARLCRPTKHSGTRVRGLHPWDAADVALLRAVHRGEFAIQGVRNRDLQSILYTTAPATDAERRRRSARIGRLLRLLRAHGLIKKVARTHRYLVTEHGRDAISAILTAHDVSLQQLQQSAA